jgi:hypothetical protein
MHAIWIRPPSTIHHEPMAITQPPYNIYVPNLVTFPLPRFSASSSQIR